MFIGYLKKSVLLTYLGTAIACTGMILACTGKIRYAVICLMASAICDMFDGTVARKCKRTNEEKEFGIQIDSLADTINFVAFPVVLSISIGITSLYTIPAYIIFVLAGIIRLGYFNISTSVEAPSKSFKGLPVTASAILFSGFWMLSLFVPQNIFIIIYPILMALTGFFNVLNIKIPKPGKVAYIIFVLLFIAMVFVVLFVRK